VSGRRWNTSASCKKGTRQAPPRSNADAVQAINADISDLLPFNYLQKITTASDSMKLGRRG